MIESNLDTFAMSFLGQQITVTVDLNHTINFNTSPDHTVESMPIFYEGVLLDYDKEWLFLGESSDSGINQAIERSRIVHVMTIEEKDVYTQVLDEMPEPTSEEIN